MGQPVSDARVALVTSSGHSVAGDDSEPFGVKNMTQEESIPRIAHFLRSKPQLSVIPADTPRFATMRSGCAFRGSS